MESPSTLFSEFPPEESEETQGFQQPLTNEQNTRKEYQANSIEDVNDIPTIFPTKKDIERSIAYLNQMNIKLRESEINCNMNGETKRYTHLFIDELPEEKVSGDLNIFAASEDEYLALKTLAINSTHDQVLDFYATLRNRYNNLNSRYSEIFQKLYREKNFFCDDVCHFNETNASIKKTKYGTLMRNINSILRSINARVNDQVRLLDLRHYIYTNTPPLIENVSVEHVVLSHIFGRHKCSWGCAGKISLEPASDYHILFATSRDENSKRGTKPFKSSARVPNYIKTRPNKNMWDFQPNYSTLRGDRPVNIGDLGILSGLFSGVIPYNNDKFTIAAAYLYVDFVYIPFVNKKSPSDVIRQNNVLADAIYDQNISDYRRSQHPPEPESVFLAKNIPNWLFNFKEDSVEKNMSQNLAGTNLNRRLHDTNNYAMPYFNPIAWVRHYNFQKNTFLEWLYTYDLNYNIVAESLLKSVAQCNFNPFIVCLRQDSNNQLGLSSFLLNTDDVYDDIFKFCDALNRQKSEQNMSENLFKKRIESFLNYTNENISSYILSFTVDSNEIRALINILRNSGINRVSRDNLLRHDQSNAFTPGASSGQNITRQWLGQPSRGSLKPRQDRQQSVRQTIRRTPSQSSEVQLPRFQSTGQAVTNADLFGQAFKNKGFANEASRSRPRSISPESGKQQQGSIAKNVKKSFKRKHSVNESSEPTAKESNREGSNLRNLLKSRAANRSDARPANRSEARPVNRSEARPVNRSEARPVNRSEARPANRQSKSFKRRASASNNYEGPRQGSHKKFHGQGRR